MTKVIIIHKAQQTGNIPVSSMTIGIDEPIKEFMTIEAQDAFCGEEAMKLERALYSTLPGGTYDRLLGVMLLRKAGHLRIAHTESNNN